MIQEKYLHEMLDVQLMYIQTKASDISDMIDQLFRFEISAQGLDYWGDMVSALGDIITQMGVELARRGLDSGKLHATFERMDAMILEDQEKEESAA